MSKLHFAFAVSTALLGSVGCSTLDRAADCQKVCDKKKECADKNYDVVACVDYCRMQAQQNESYSQKLNDCSACFETRACAEALECYLKGSCPSLP